MIKIGNCSGFYGDRISAMREMLEDGELDYLTGDYLAELTMLILGKDTFKDPNLGYARTFVRQAEDCMGLALEKGVKIVSNAGGLNPRGLADKLREIAGGLGLNVAIAHIEGDDLRPKVAELGLANEYGDPLTANAYLGAFGIASALKQGADVVVTGRVTDASVVVGPAIAAFDWQTTDYDPLAAAVVAGHIIECGTQATGGNFAGFLTLPDRRKPFGFPIAEISADGGVVITKHEGTGGAVLVDTVTAQLVYEIQTTTYLNPDVSVDLSSIELSQQGTDRVAISGVRGFEPPENLKVCLNHIGGLRNSCEVVVTGLDIEEKIAWIKQQVEDSFDGDLPARLEWSNPGVAPLNAATEEAGSVLLRLSAFDTDANKVGKAFTAPLVELALASYPGLSLTSPPGKPSPYGVYSAAYVPREAVEHRVVHANGDVEVIADPETAAGAPEGVRREAGALTEGVSAEGSGSTTTAPLGSFVYARSGDKGGDANVGLWVRHDDDPRYEARVAWLLGAITPESVRALLPEAQDLGVEVYPLPNLGGVNVLIRGLLGAGVAATSRFDPQAKGVGEWIRSRFLEIPEGLL